MTEPVNNSSNAQEENPVDVSKWLMFGFVGGLIVAVLAMEYYGYIQHPSDSSNARIDEFALLSLAPEYNVKVSEKPSGKEGFCVDGYLLLRPTNGKAVAGILVDAKNRPVACKQHFATREAPEEVGEPAVGKQTEQAAGNQ